MKKLIRIFLMNGLGSLVQIRNFLAYKKQLNQLRLPFTYKKILNGDHSVSQNERFSHYEVFDYLVGKWIGSQTGLTIVDLGSRKSLNARNSLANHLVSIVLTDPGDTFTEIQYQIQDASDKWDIDAGSVDLFTSCVSLHLIGLARYGDRLNAKALSHSISEIERILKPHGRIIISVPVGPNQLRFNNGWILDIDTWMNLLRNFNLIQMEYEDKSIRGVHKTGDQKADLRSLRPGDCFTCIMHFEYLGFREIK